MARRGTVSGGKLLGIIALCILGGGALGCLLFVHPLLMVAGIVLGILIFVWILAFRSGQKVPPLMLAILLAVLAVTAGLGLYLGLADPALTYQDVMEDPKIQAALHHGNDVIPEDGKLTPGPWVLLQKTGSDRTYTPTYCSKGRLTRKVLEKLQTVVIVSDSQIIDSGEYVFEQYGKQVGSNFTLHRYRLRLWYYDVQKGKVVRVDVVDGSPLKEDGSGGGISKSEIVQTVKAAMEESARQGNASGRKPDAPEEHPFFKMKNVCLRERDSQGGLLLPHKRESLFPEYLLKREQSRRNSVS